MPYETLIDTAALRSLLGDPGIAILDCRFDLAQPGAGRRSYLEGHILTARYADLNRDLSSPVTPTTGRHPLPEPKAFARRLGELGVGDGTQVVAYDEANGAMAARAWWLLKWLGHPQAAVLDGGFRAWVAAGGPIETKERPVAHASLTPHVQVDAVIDAAALEHALRDPGRLLIDARAAERFAGAIEPIDPIAGHVPGAVNHPFSSNLREDGRFLAPAELEKKWAARLGGIAPEDVIAMCGSGVTACHNLLAMERAGLKGAKLYAGSWSEWIRDPRRPIARGD
jgi:thiosulfate/3-mercaptopyruvate sulfurtransferase